jgi:putative intracellular protease/amidase
MSEADATSQTFLKEQKALWTNTEKLSDVLPRASEFDAIFYVGGHGRKFMFPLPYIHPFPSLP